MDKAVAASLARLQQVLESCAPAAVAVSGGVDSMTLAYISARLLGERVTMYHAVSAAVPPAATARVERYAANAGWRLISFNAGEFNDEDYLSNPANRCFYCKTNLYAAICQHTSEQVLSGTNLDDLGDWRPGLKAAQQHAVRHPYVEAGINKTMVRQLASHFELNDLAQLPAAPCLSSRVETGLRIEKNVLDFIDAAEQRLRDLLKPTTVRCRRRAVGIVVELDEHTYAELDATRRTPLALELAELAERFSVAGEISFAAYQRGSAFLRDVRPKLDARATHD